MTKKGANNDNAGELKKSISSILVVNDKDLKPYIELFEYTGENIVQQQLGTLLGTFEVRDDSEDSAYIVNFLTSVAKKEYFVNPKRPAAESFEIALHKINLALSELANHGNVNWLGKLDAAICVLGKTSLHFSVAGNAKILLLRNNVLTDISEGLASDEPEPHPIKTFTNISSGKLEKNDKLIVTGDDLFRVFSLTEIKKGASRFDNEKFVQFIKTALINELEAAGTIIIDVFEEQLPEEKPEEKPKKKKGRIFNVFSEMAYKNTSPGSSKVLINEEKENEYVDKKTGHIYVQGEYNKHEENNYFSDLSFIIKEKLVDLKYWTKNRAGKIKEGIKEMTRKIKEESAKKRLEKKENLEEKAEKPIKTPFKINSVMFREKLNYLTFNAGKFIKNVSFRKFIPNLSVIKNELKKMDYQQRIYSLLIIVAIIFIPIIWIKYQNGVKKSSQQQEQPAVPTPAEIFAQDKNMNLGASSQILYSEEGLANPVLLNDELFTISKNKITRVKNEQEKEEFLLPEDSGNAVIASPMKDLGLIFILTDQNKMISFSIVSNKFRHNNISVPENSKISSLATYLTYAYLIDTQNNQIYRYPRAEGGFGEKADWLNEEVDIKNTSGVAIDENVYLVGGEKILKLFRGKKQEFNAEQSATPVKFNKIFTNTETQNIYILDSVNGRLVKFNKTGELLSQYYNEQIKDALGLAVDEKNNKAYFNTSTELISLAL